MLIRNVEDSDLIQLTKLYNLVFPEWKLSSIKELCDFDATKSWILLDGRKIIGLSIRGLRYVDGAYIPYIFAFGIHPNYRRRALGNFLMSVVCRENPLYLTVRSSNCAAIKLYQKHGFKVESIEERIYNLPKEDGFLMKSRT